MEKYQKDLFNESTYFVEANGFEYLSLWRKNKGEYKGKWEEIPSGFSFTLGTVVSREKTFPVILSFRFAKINGDLICFYEPVSQCVDWLMIEEWLIENIPNFKGNHSDCINFTLPKSYTISEEPIRLNDWCIDIRDKKTFQAKEELTNHWQSGNMQYQKSYCKKIIKKDL